MTETRTVSATGGEKGEKPERYDLIPVEPLAEVARHYGKGAEKYEDRNWEKGYEWHKSFAALMRHIQAFWGGESVDPEMGTHHLAAAVFHCFTLMQFEEHHPQYDDRSDLVKVEDMPPVKTLREAWEEAKAADNVVNLAHRICGCGHRETKHYVAGGGGRGSKFDIHRGACRELGCSCGWFKERQ